MCLFIYVIESIIVVWIFISIMIVLFFDEEDGEDIIDGDEYI